MQSFKFLDAIQTFNPILDGERHTMTTFWNFAAERWYFKLVDSTSDFVCFLPVIGSTQSEPINQLHGYFTSSMIFNVDTSSFEVTP